MSSTPDLTEKLVYRRVLEGLFQEAPEPIRVGRYILLDEIGEGAMGVVHGAYDEMLDRKIALKFVHAERVISPESRARMLREAKAMARLSHPNVVQIYDAGEYESGLFIAMELIEGQTLRAWLRSGGQARTWQEAVRIFGAAGAGLAAAHDVGVVHRDFKPDNVLVTKAGEPKVADFGLAGFNAVAPTPTASSDADRSGEAVAGLTLTGTVLGTPFYMAPEQHEGRSTDARTDQFTFCVAFYEALFGQRPFEGDDPDSLRRAVTEGRVRPPPNAAKVPSSIGRVVLRGLSLDPSDRFDSMHALLAELSRAPRRRRRFLLVGALGATTAAIMGSTWLHGWTRERACERAGRAIAEVWGPARGDQARSKFVATELVYAQTSWESVQEQLDAYAVQWREARTATCIAARSDPRWTTEVVDRSTACLDDRAAHLESLVDIFVNADDDVVRRAVGAVGDLPPIDPCRDPDYVSKLVPIPDDPTLAGEVAARRSELARVSAHNAAGAYAEALRIARGVLESAEDLGYAPLVAEARFWTGWMLHRAGQYDDAVRTLEEAYFEAGLAQVGAVEVDAAIRLTYLLGPDLDRYDEAERWSKHANVALERAGGDSLREAIRLDAAGRTYLGLGRYDEAIDHHQRALTLVEDTLGQVHPMRSAMLENIAIVRSVEGRHLEAIEMYERVRVIASEASGPLHPRVGRSTNNIGIAHLELGDLDAALTALETALPILVAAYGENHADVAKLLGNIGLIHRRRGDLDAALSYYERTVELLTRSHGPDAWVTAMSIHNIGNVLIQKGDYAAAVERFTEVVRVAEATHEPQHPLLATALGGLANAHFYGGDFVDAEPLYRRVVDIRVHALGAQDPRTADSRMSLGMALREQGRLEAALVEFEAAADALAGADGTPHAHLLAQARFELAQTLAGLQRDPAHARDLAELALKGYLAAGDRFASQREALEGWLAEH